MAVVLAVIAGAAVWWHRDWPRRRLEAVLATELVADVSLGRLTVEQGPRFVLHDLEVRRMGGQPLLEVARVARITAESPVARAARADFDHRTFPKPFKRSRIELNEPFLDRVVPAILEGTSDIKPEGDTLAKFLAINGELRRKNADKIASFASQTAPEMLWNGVVFHPFTNSAVESAFADQRTYLYKGREVDRQVHLGFDLASLAGAPVLAANRGKVLYADELGIYGNCVILDHGMGVQSLYAHLSSIDVQPGQTVEK